VADALEQLTNHGRFNNESGVGINGAPFSIGVYHLAIISSDAMLLHRQVIVVTHNANIAVLGDAELIIPLRGASEVSVIRDRGSIDTATTKKMVCTILEGSERAFKRRHELYGFRV
jgi:hypothetical protein